MRLFALQSTGTELPRAAAGAAVPVAEPPGDCVRALDRLAPDAGKVDGAHAERGTRDAERRDDLAVRAPHGSGDGVQPFLELFARLSVPARADLAELGISLADR